MAKEVKITPETENKVTLFSTVKAAQAGKMAQKAVCLTTAENALLEANELYSQGDDKAKEANDKAALAALPLYKGQIEGVISKEETSALLGKVFGFKAKADGSASKTPEKKGEAIRKRIVRSVDVFNYVNGKADAPSFLEGETEADTNSKLDQASAILDDMDKGNLSIWSAYDYLGDLKTKTEAVPLAFDPSRLAKMVTTLTEDGAIERVAMSPALKAVYAALADQLIALSDYIDGQDEETAQTQAA